MAKKKEDPFEKLARLIKEESEDARSDIKKYIDERVERSEKKMDIRFTGLERRLDTIIQPQLDNHAKRVKTLEFKTAKL